MAQPDLQRLTARCLLMTTLLVVYTVALATTAWKMARTNRCGLLHSLDGGGMVCMDSFGCTAELIEQLQREVG